MRVVDKYYCCICQDYGIGENYRRSQGNNVSSEKRWKCKHVQGWEVMIDLLQEIIKVREWIPHIGPLTKVVPLKLFLDMVPSSSEDVARAMSGQPKRSTFSNLPETKWQERLCSIYHKIQMTIKQDSYTKANESGKEAQNETMRLIDIVLPQSENKVNSNSKARIESKMQWRQVSVN